jgi:hypothetical protein
VPRPITRGIDHTRPNKVGCACRLMAAFLMTLPRSGGAFFWHSVSVRPQPPDVTAIVDANKMF